MVNQWGRDGSSSSGSARSGGGFLIPAIVALIIGGAGGYAGARYLSGVSVSDIQSRDKKIEQLQQTLSEMKFDNQGSATQETVLRDRVKELEDQLAAANRTKESLRAEIASEVQRARDEAKAEIDALQRTLDEAGDVNGELGRARKSLKVSELQIIELEKTLKDQKTAIDSLQSAAASNAGEAAATLAALKKTNDNLRASLDEAKRRLAEIPSLEDEIAALKEQLSQKSAGADDAARREIERLNKDLDTRQQQLGDALRAASDAGRLAKEIEGLKKQLDQMAVSLAERDADARGATKDLKKASATIGEQSREIENLKGENDTLKKSQAALAKQVEDLKAELVKPADETEPAKDKPVDNGMTPRDRNAVEKAVEDMPGYSNLNDAKREQLVDMLARGECVTTALKAAYGRVPTAALRNLIRELGGRC